ncbi:hypothetical protein [Celeribacter sp.]|uniref:hypothetical protein n=1 Tax=Celeribacter sp. TaxID=1890673 RepID=UPI003A8CAF2D
MDQRVSLNERTPARPQEPVVETQNWMPPAAPLAMPKQVLEPQTTHWPALADVARMLFLRRKT